MSYPNEKPEKGHPEEQPPSYNDSERIHGQAPAQMSQNEQYPPEKESEQFRYQGQSQGPPSGQWQGQGSDYDPMQDPSVYKVKPQKVNISIAPPTHLNPSYPQFQQREQERAKQGIYPVPPEAFKHGPPLAPGHKNPTNKTGGGSFPGRSGATYNSAANR